MTIRPRETYRTGKALAPITSLLRLVRAPAVVAAEAEIDGLDAVLPRLRTYGLRFSHES